MRHALVALLLLACTTQPEPARPPKPPPTPLPPIADGGQSLPTGTPCMRAGARIEALQCKSATGAALWKTPNGEPFANACEAAREDGRDWHPECLAKLPDCGYLLCAFRGECC